MNQKLIQIPNTSAAHQASIRFLIALTFCVTIATQSALGASLARPAQLPAQLLNCPKCGQAFNFSTGDDLTVFLQHTQTHQDLDPSEVTATLKDVLEKTKTALEQREKELDRQLGLGQSLQTSHTTQQTSPNGFSRKRSRQDH